MITLGATAKFPVNVIIVNSDQSDTRLREITVITDHRSTAWAVFAPYQSSNKLECIGRPKFVNTKQALGTLSHVFGRLNLVPAATQIVKACIQASRVHRSARKRND